MGFLQGIFVGLLEKLLSKLGSWLFKKGKEIIKEREIDEKVDKEVAAVKGAQERARKALEECEKSESKECRVPAKEEKELREATRDLIDNLFG